MLKNRQRNIHTCFFTCFWAPSAMRSFMLNLQSFTNVSMSPAGSPEPSTSMLSDGAWPLSFSLILSKKKHLKRREKNKVVSGSVICLYFKKKEKKKEMHAESSYRDVMISSHTFTGSTLASGYRSVHDLMRCLRESKDTNKKNCKNCKNVSELEKKNSNKDSFRNKYSKIL